jgi:mannosyltransferase OCH1-like enzyme
MNHSIPVNKSIMEGYKIPNIVHQTFKNSKLPLEIIKIISDNKKMCPNFKFIFYDDNACDKFIKNNYDSHIYKAYKSINDCYGAMKADFFRYCVLYKLGGVYLDIKSKINKPLFNIIQKDDICLLDIPRSNLEPWRKNAPTYEQWLLIFAPNHPYLLETINTLTNYIHTKFQPKIPGMNVLNTKQKILHVTGPDAFTKCINNYINNKNDNNIKLHRNINYNHSFQLNVGGSNYKKMYTINNQKHYSELNLPLYK